MTIPSPINNHLIDKEPITGVIMKGNNVIKITGPFNLFTKLFTHSAKHIPKIITKGNVINVKVIVNLRA